MSDLSFIFLYLYFFHLIYTVCLALHFNACTFVMDFYPFDAQQCEMQLAQSDDLQAMNTRYSIFPQSQSAQLHINRSTVCQLFQKFQIRVLIECTF